MPEKRRPEKAGAQKITSVRPEALKTKVTKSLPIETDTKPLGISKDAQLTKGWEKRYGRTVCQLV